MYPGQVSPIFFMNDQCAPEWKVVLSYEPQSRRTLTSIEYEVLGAAGSPIDSERMVPSKYPLPFECEGVDIV